MMLGNVKCVKEQMDVWMEACIGKSHGNVGPFQWNECFKRKKTSFYFA